VEDAGAIMSVAGHFQFVMWTLLQIVWFFLLQLPRKYKVHIDKDLFFRSVTIIDENGERKFAKYWPEGPEGYQDRPADAMDVDVEAEEGAEAGM
jgi:hypothetical protein